MAWNNIAKLVCKLFPVGLVMYESKNYNVSQNLYASGKMYLLVLLSEALNINTHKKSHFTESKWQSARVRPADGNSCGLARIDLVIGPMPPRCVHSFFIGSLVSSWGLHSLHLVLYRITFCWPIGSTGRPKWETTESARNCPWQSQTFKLAELLI